MFSKTFSDNLLKLFFFVNNCSVRISYVVCSSQEFSSKSKSAGKVSDTLKYLHFKGQLLALLANIKLTFIDLTVKNTLAYFAAAKKCFLRLRDGKREKKGDI